MKKNIFIVCNFIVAILFCACGFKQDTTLGIMKDAKFFDKTEEYATEYFLSKNKTHKPFENDDLPESICKIIDTQAEYILAFSAFPAEVDFSQDVLIVYCFTDIYYGFACRLQTITENDGEITINILHEMAKKDSLGVTPPSTSVPTQRCLVVKLSNHVCTNVNVKINYS